MVALRILASLATLLAFALFVACDPAPIVDPEAACSPSNYAECLEVETGLVAVSTECEGESLRICLVPLGKVSPDLVAHLTDYYEKEYGLRISVLGPGAIPESLLNDERRQIDALDLQELIQTRFPQYQGNADVILIGLTPVDVYIGTSDWRYAFGMSYPQPVISTARMSPAAYGANDDNKLWYIRVRKLMSKYIGLWYYDLELSDDPDSPMFNNILSPDDLDRMDEPLPVEDAR
jgi:predicted Zn-dependent protease